MRKIIITVLVTLAAVAVLGGVAVAGRVTAPAQIASRPAAAVQHKAPSPKSSPARHRRHHHARQAPAAAAPTPVAPAPVVPANPQLTNASAVVMQFYQDLTNHDYAGAWALGGDNIGGSDYNSWVTGYATTASITVDSYGTWDDGTAWADISALQTDGTTRTYSGTYTVAGGVIVSADITQTS